MEEPHASWFAREAPSKDDPEEYVDICVCELLSPIFLGPQPYCDSERVFRTSIVSLTLRAGS